MATGVIGLGNMGRAIAERLIEQGHDLIVWNRSPGKAEGLIQTETVKAPRSVIEGTDIVISVLANDAAVDAVYFGPDGICSGPLDGKLIIEMCTMSPERAAFLEREVEAKGGQFLECPVGGTIAPARAGQLLGLAGGSAAAFDRARPLLATLTRRLEHLGPAGSGAAMKLAINLPLMVYWSALGEALGLVLDKGVDPTLALHVLADSSGAIGAAKKRVPPIRDMLIEGDPGSVNFSLLNAIKDMRLMADLARENGQGAQVISAALAKAEAAARDGFAELDCSLVGLHGKTGK